MALWLRRQRYHHWLVNPARYHFYEFMLSLLGYDDLETVFSEDALEDEIEALSGRAVE